MAPEPMVAALLVRRLVVELTAEGIGRDALLAEAGVSPETLALTRVRVPWSLVEDLLEAAERLTGDDRIGFHVAARYDLEALALPGLLFFASRTLREGVQRLERLQRLWSNAYRGWFVPSLPGMRYELYRPERRAHVHLHEQALAMTLHVMREATGARIPARALRFTHARHGDPTPYERYFGCPVQFGAGVTEMVIAPEHLELPLLTWNPLFAGHFERQAEAELTALTADRRLGERLRELLEEDLAALRLGESSLETSAARLRTSARTLQRGLGAEGTSFARELEAVRRAAAEQMLLGGMDIAETSWRLGYAEPPVFHRAFKRWTGDTPEGFRQRRVGER